MIHLIRHTHAGKRSAWDGPDDERPLSERGWQQAQAVAGQLEVEGVTRILTSPYVRCVQSVEPLSALTGIEVEIERALEEGAPGAAIDRLLATLEGGEVLCSHGDVVSGLIGRLAAEGADLDAGLIWEKASVWHLERRGQRWTGRYAPPPATET